MFGGLTKTSSRIAIAAALGLTLGGYAMSTPAKAADLGGDCCADLEERVAELEATTVRKGNKKVSVTLSGWVVKSLNWWDDGNSGFAVGDKDYDLGSRFAITGSATIAPGWSGGYNLTVTTGGSTYGVFSSQTSEYNSVNSNLGGTTYGNINTLYSYVYVKSDKYGTLNWGHLSPASDNPAVLADISGTVIESNFVGFEGGGFGLNGGMRAAPTATGAAAVSGGTFNDFWVCSSGVAPGADCFGAAEPAVRYDSPTWGGFRFETSYGTASVVPAVLNNNASANLLDALYNHPSTDSSHFWDAAAFYNGDWGNWKTSFAYAYTWLESNPLNGGEESIHQVGGTVMHTPSGLGVYAMAEWEDVSASNGARCPGITGNVSENTFLANTTQGGAIPVGGTGAGCLVGGNALPDTDMWGVKPFIKRTWNPLGATILYGEYAQYNDFYGVALANGVGVAAVNGNTFANCGASASCSPTGSELQRWGLGAVQEIDSAAMHLWARWQHQDLDISFVDNVTGVNGKQGFDDFDLFQAGGIIFF